MLQVNEDGADITPAVNARKRCGDGETVAKIILFGEHSVVYGYPAIAMPLLNLRMKAHVEPSNKPTSLHCLGWSGPISQAPQRFSSVKEALRVALEFVGDPGAQLSISTESDFPPERGLGSSAAAAGAVIRAVLNSYNRTVSPQQLFELTQCAERIAHGKPSGLDATATASNVPVFFRDGTTTPIEINLASWIIVADSGIHGSTRETVGHVRAEYEASEKKVWPKLAELGAITEDAVKDIGMGDVEALGQKMNRAHQLLSELGVSNQELDTLTDAARKAGAVGAKLTGGGRGGCVIALANSSEDAHRITEALARAGAQNTWVYAPHVAEVSA